MNANLMTKKIEMSKSEAKEAGKLNTEKFHELRQYMATGVMERIDSNGNRTQSA